MNRLKIFVDIDLPVDALEMLRDGIGKHQLILSQTRSLSISTAAKRDSQLCEADIAFGQPDPHLVVEATQLKWIHISSAGFTRYDTLKFRELVARHKIAVTNSSSVFSESCAIHVLSFMLAQARKLPRALEARTEWGSEVWRALRGGGVLREETVLIAGYGAIGKRLVELLRPFDMKIAAFRRKPRGDEGILVISEDHLDEALGKADHIINILPASAETFHFFNRARFTAIKPGAVFYNIGRGATVDQDALLEALVSARLAAAWLDVTDPEPLPDDHPLLTQPNCFITPHTAGGHVDESKTLLRHFLNNFELYVQGRPLLDRVM